MFFRYDLAHYSPNSAREFQTQRSDSFRHVQRLRHHLLTSIVNARIRNLRTNGIGFYGAMYTTLAGFNCP